MLMILFFGHSKTFNTHTHTHIHLNLTIVSMINFCIEIKMLYMENGNFDSSNEKKNDDDYDNNTFPSMGGECGKKIQPVTLTWSL